MSEYINELLVGDTLWVYNEQTSKIDYLKLYETVTPAELRKLWNRDFAKENAD